jgi:hypothetical protein
MNQHRIVAAVALLAVVGTAIGRAQGADISGTWNVSVDVGDVHGTPVFIFEQKGETLTGTVTNQAGTQKIAGTVKDGRVVFGFEAVRDGEPFKAVYTGTVNSATRLAGTVEFSGALAGTGTWTATRK